MVVLAAVFAACDDGATTDRAACPPFDGTIVRAEHLATIPVVVEVRALRLRVPSCESGATSRFEVERALHGEVGAEEIDVFLPPLGGHASAALEVGDRAVLLLEDHGEQADERWHLYAAVRQHDGALDVVGTDPPGLQPVLDAVANTSDDPLAELVRLVSS